jgi:hypothetical protein
MNEAKSLPVALRWRSGEAARWALEGLRDRPDRAVLTLLRTAPCALSLSALSALPAVPGLDDEVAPPAVFGRESRLGSTAVRFSGGARFRRCLGTAFSIVPSSNSRSNFPSPLQIYGGN